MHGVVRQRRGNASPALTQSVSAPALGGGGDYDGNEVYSRTIRAGPNRVHADFEERPYQVIIGSLMVGVMILLGFHPPQFVRINIIQESLPGNAFRTAMWASLLFFVVYSSLISINALMSRPHPMLWRALHGWNIWYCIFAVVFLVIPVSDGETMVEWIFPSGRVKKVGGTMGYDHLACQITTETVKRQLKSIWFLAHCLGWCAKMLMLRDWKMCLVYSTFFELTELSLQFLIPEFQECWWDSVFMDWGGANVAGMLAGALILHILNAKKYQWQRLGESQGLKRKSSRLLNQLTPLAWLKYKWNPTHDPRGLVLNAVIWIVMAIGEVNSFFLINLMQLPTEHIFNKARQLLLVLTAMPAVAEWYHYCQGHTQRIGHFTWLLMVTVALETAAVIKYWTKLNRVQKAVPSFDIWGPWLGSALIFSVYFVVHCYLRFVLKNETVPLRLRVLKYTAFVPLLLLCRLYAF